MARDRIEVYRVYQNYVVNGLLNGYTAVTNPHKEDTVFVSNYMA